MSSDKKRADLTPPEADGWAWEEEGGYPERLKELEECREQHNKKEE